MVVDANASRYVSVMSIDIIQALKKTIDFALRKLKIKIPRRTETSHSFQLKYLHLIGSLIYTKELWE